MMRADTVTVKIRRSQIVEFDCSGCGYSWYPKASQPKQCPSCRVRIEWAHATEEATPQPVAQTIDQRREIAIQTSEYEITSD